MDFIIVQSCLWDDMFSGPRVNVDGEPQTHKPVQYVKDQIL